MFCRAPFLPKKVPSPSRTLQDPNLGSGVPKLGSGVENTKVAYQKNMQNPMVDTPNGAICYKLWPKHMLGWMGQNLKEILIFYCKHRHASNSSFKVSISLFLRLRSLCLVIYNFRAPPAAQPGHERIHGLLYPNTMKPPQCKHCLGKNTQVEQKSGMA